MIQILVNREWMYKTEKKKNHLVEYYIALKMHKLQFHKSKWDHDPQKYTLEQITEAYTKYYSIYIKFKSSKTK